MCDCRQAQYPDYMGGLTNAGHLFIKELIKDLVMSYEETLGGHAPPSKPYYRGKMGRCGKEKQNATNRPQEDI